MLSEVNRAQNGIDEGMQGQRISIHRGRSSLHQPPPPAREVRNTTEGLTPNAF